MDFTRSRACVFHPRSLLIRPFSDGNDIYRDVPDTFLRGYNIDTGRSAGKGERRGGVYCKFPNGPFENSPLHDQQRQPRERAVNKTRRSFRRHAEIYAHRGSGYASGSGSGTVILYRRVKTHPVGCYPSPRWTQPSLAAAAAAAATHPPTEYACAFTRRRRDGALLPRPMRGETREGGVGGG